MFNTLVVLGASALFAPVAVKGNILKRDFPFCIGITAVMIVLLMTLNHGDIALTRLDGIILLALFAVFMVGSVVMGKTDNSFTHSRHKCKFLCAFNSKLTADHNTNKADYYKQEAFPHWQICLFAILRTYGGNE